MTRSVNQLRTDIHQANRLSWNEATTAHNSHKSDQGGFFKRGGHTLFPEEIAMLGDLTHKKIVHLQCNAGQDTLSLSALGAASVTGVDISDVAIDFARQLANDSEIEAIFECQDVFDWLEASGNNGRQFDVAFSSYGALCWLSDIEIWAKGIAAILRPGGRLVVVEFHPLSMVFEDDWSLKYPYFGEGRAIQWEDGIGDYVAAAGAALAPSGYISGRQDFKNPYPSFEFQWGIGDVLSAVLNAGLEIMQFTEYPYMNGAKLFDEMVEGSGRRFFPPKHLPSLPLMFGLVAQKEAIT